MHELPVTQALLDLTLQRASLAQAARVTDIHVEIGELSSYVDDSVQFYWDLISRGTVAEGARLHFQRVPLELVCSKCGAQFQPHGQFACLECGSDAVKVAAGEGFRLVALDIEKQPKRVAQVKA